MMCRFDVDPAARELLAGVMGSLRDAVAARWGVDQGGIRVGPIDFGTPDVDEIPPRM